VPSLTDALRALRAARWVDLTHAFEPGIPHYVAFPDEERREVCSFERDGFSAHVYAHVGQWGTHVDPPSHFVQGGRALDELPVTDMLLELRVVDLREACAADPDRACSVADLEAHEAAHGRIPDGAFVALHTGWDARWPDPDAMAGRDADGVAHSPGWGVDAVEWLVRERAVTAIGHDVTDTDPGAVVSAGSAPAETAILAADRWQVELLANLGDVPPAGALVLVAWPKPRGGTGFPARVVALVPA
jgi:kynurenine formamidase